MTIIREAELTDHHAIVAMYPDVFPDEDLVPLVNNLHAQAEGLVSLVAVAASGQVIGHISLTRCSVSDFDIPVYLLGPLAVSPSHQRSGHGRALIEAGLDRVRALGASQIYVLGDPVYYSRVGFSAETVVTPPYALPPEWDGAWQSRALVDPAPKLLGKLQVPDVWNKKELWQP